MKKLKFLFDKKPKDKGQSFIEMTVIMFFLIPLVFGMVEFGNLLNQYITLVDGAREGALFASNGDPITVSTLIPDPEGAFYYNIQKVIEGDPENPASNVPSAISPIVLDHDKNDDIVVSYYSVEQGTKTASLKGTRSLLNHKSSLVTPDIVNLNINDKAPSTGLVVVEIFHRYQQIFTFLDYNVDLHAYAIMPLSSVEPTPTP